MAETLHLMGEEIATLLIPQGIVKETESKIQYLVIQDKKDETN